MERRAISLSSRIVKSVDAALSRISPRFARGETCSPVQNPSKASASLIESLEGRQLLAATYYVSPTGSDSNAGNNVGAPWRTVSKVNSKAFGPGDKILFK